MKKLEMNGIKQENKLFENNNTGDKRFCFFKKTTIGTVNNYPKEYIENINEINRRVDKLEVIFQEKNESVKSLEHNLDLDDFSKIYLLSKDDLAKIIEDNKVFENIIDSQEERDRRFIIKNLEFLKESNHEEKTALVWMYFSRLSSNLDNFNIFLNHQMIDNIRFKYPLIKDNILFFQSAPLFNKFGIFEQGTIKSSSFEKEYYEKNNQTHFKLSIEEIYSKIPELKILFNKNGKLTGIKFSSLIPYISNLEFAGRLLLKEIGFTFKDSGVNNE